jgi:nicotinamidase-related amidase
MLDEETRRFANVLKNQTALLCIDLQYLDAARGHGVFAPTAQADSGGAPGEAPWDTSLEATEYYFERLESTVVPNVARLQRAFRLRGIEVIHTRIQSLTRDGRDRGRQHKRLNLHAPPGSRDAQFLDELAPEDDEIVINKTASGVFNSTNLEIILGNLGIRALVIAGVYTDECVSTTARHACDLGFDTIIVEDGCASVTRDRHEFTIATLRDRYARVLSTDDLIAEIDRALPGERSDRPS